MVSLDSHNYLLVMLDIEGYSLRAVSDQATLHTELYEAADLALGRAGVGPADRTVQDRGDGMLILLPATLSPTLLLRELSRGLQDALADHHGKFREELRMRLRVGLHMGTVIRQGDRWSSDAINDLARLVDAQPVKDVLKAATQAHMVVVVSPELHSSVVVGRHPGIDPAAYLPFDFVTKHREPRRGWVTVPGYPAPPGLPPVSGEPPAGAGAGPGAGGGTGGRDGGAGGSAPPRPVADGGHRGGGDAPVDHGIRERFAAVRSIKVKGDYVEGDKNTTINTTGPVVP
jgi:hypothetical protein